MMNIDLRKISVILFDQRHAPAHLRKTGLQNGFRVSCILAT